jgi:hypothetical protein
MIIGMDFGGVLCLHDKKGESKINMPGAIEALNILNKNEHDVYLISYGGSKEFIYNRWLNIKKDGYDVYFTHQYYVKQRNFKKYICDYIGCQIMIDDRIEILDDIKENNPGIITILFGEYTTNESHYLANNWEQVVELINNIRVNPQPLKDIDVSNYIQLVK